MLPSSLYFGEFRAAIERLAWPAGEQIAYLYGGGTPGTMHDLDDLAWEFIDVFFVVTQLIHEGRMSEQEAEPLYALERKLDEILKSPPSEQLWTEEAISYSPRWEEVRKLASAALSRVTSIQIPDR
jgi:hypothetical protein